MLGLVFYCKFPRESACETILKIGLDLTKILPLMYIHDGPEETAHRTHSHNSVKDSMVNLQ